MIRIPLRTTLLALLALAAPGAASGQIAGVDDAFSQAASFRRRHESGRSSAGSGPQIQAGPVAPRLSPQQQATADRLQGILFQGGGARPEDRAFVQENLGKHLPSLAKTPDSGQMDALKGWYGSNAEKLGVLSSENCTTYNCFAHASRVTDRTVLTEGGTQLQFDRHFLEQGYIRTSDPREAAAELIMDPDGTGGHARTYYETNVPGKGVQRYAVDKNGFDENSVLTISPVGKDGRPITDQGPSGYYKPGRGQSLVYYKHGTEEQLQKARQRIEKREEDAKQKGAGQEDQGRQPQQPQQGQPGSQQ